MNLDIGLSNGKKFTLPLEAVTQTFAILGKRGSGKTSTAVVLAEEFVSRDLQVCIIDPLDCWHGIRAARDGKNDGLPVVIIGGEHGDVPVIGNDGATIADFLVEHLASTVISLRHLSNNEQRSFVTSFAERLYDLKGKGANKTPLHLVIDEADAYVPQRLFHGAERCFGAIDRIVRRGRSSGLGVTLISQRSAAINKDVLSQAEVLVAHRTISPQDRKAIEAWIEAHDAHDQHDEFMASLASLPIGTAWFWSPGWLEIFQQVQVRQRRTFDSSATPKVGAKPVAPVKLAAVDIEALCSKLAKTIEAKKADDPRELRKEIADLKTRLEKHVMTTAPNERARKRIVDDAHRHFQVIIKKLQARLNRAYGFILQIDKESDHIKQACDPVSVAAEMKIELPLTQAEAETAYNAAPAVPVSPRRIKEIVDFAASNGAGLPKCERAILAVLAQYPDNGRNKNQVAIIAGYAVNSGGFNNALSKLKQGGYITAHGGLLFIKEAGMNAIGNVEVLPAGRDLLAYWCNKLPKCERTILEALATLGCETDKNTIAADTGYAPNSGGFNNALSKLRTLELISGRGNELKASPLLS